MGVQMTKRPSRKMRMQELRRDWIDSKILERSDSGFAREVETVLRDAKSNSAELLFSEIVCSINADENWIGLNFIIKRTVGDTSKEISIRVTSSKRWLTKSKVTDPSIRIFYIPLQFNRKKFINSVLRLF
jgi:hypothetical protein